MTDDYFKDNCLRPEINNRSDLINNLAERSASPHHSGGQEFTVETHADVGHGSVSNWTQLNSNTPLIK